MTLSCCVTPNYICVHIIYTSSPTPAHTVLASNVGQALQGTFRRPNYVFWTIPYQSNSLPRPTLILLEDRSVGRVDVNRSMYMSTRVRVDFQQTAELYRRFTKSADRLLASSADL